jgi:MFS family permease
MQVVLLGWFVLELTDSALSVALVGFFIAAPLFILGPIGGLLADSAHRRTILRGTQAANAVAIVGTTVLLYVGHMAYWHAYLVVLVSGIAWALENPTRRSIMLDLHGRAGLANAMALEAAAMNASRMAGPALAGLLIALIDVKGGYVVASAFAVISVVTVWWLKLDLPSRAPAIKQSVMSNLAQGIAYIRTDQVILGVIAITVIMNLFLYPYLQIMPVIARDVLHVGPGHMGVMQAMDGLGALVGAVLIASAASGIRRHGLVFVGGAAISMVMLLAFSFSKTFGVSLPLLLVLGLGTSGFSAMQATIVILVAREELRGRVLGVISLAIGTGPLGALLIGGLADATSPSLAIRINAITAIVLTVLVWLFMRKMRQRTEPAEQPPPHPTVRPVLCQ